jgi:hypothetical protein
MSLPDLRIRLPAAKIDFENDVGLTGQDHDEYPPAGGQARYDHMRIFLQGLLGCQASVETPTEYSEGTLWFDLNVLCLKIRKSGAWVGLANTIGVSDTSTLADWYAAASAAIAASAPDVVYSGSCTTDGTVLINIPLSLRASVYADSRPLVFKNGLLLEPSTIRLEPGTNPTAVRITSTTLDVGDTFTVIIRRIPDTTFYSSSVTIP